MDRVDLNWDYFKVHAEQRIKAFHFFVILSVFINGGMFSALQNHFEITILITLGILIILLSIIFFIIDLRSLQLINYAKEQLKSAENARALFSADDKKRSKFVSYTSAFRALFILQALLGTSYIIYACLTK